MRLVAVLMMLLVVPMSGGIPPSAAGMALTWPWPSPVALAPIPYADFNGDRFGDLAVGVPGEDVDGQDNAGIVHVAYGSPNGLVVAGNQVWRRGADGVEGTPRAGDVFGSALAVGDFNGDRFSDLAVGAPGEDVANAADAGAVNVLYGSSGGLKGEGNQLLRRGTGGAGTASPGDLFGRALTAGDFNGDGYADLAIGMPGHDIGSADAAGAVEIRYGSPSGLLASGIQTWNQDSTNVIGQAEGGDTFGTALAAGDFNGDRFADLAIGVPGEDQQGKKDSGAVNVLYGAAGGLTTLATQLWDQGRPGVKGALEKGDRFGHALAAGDFDRDGRSDLAIGVPGEEIVLTTGTEWAIGDGVSVSGGEYVPYPGAGAVSLLYGTATGLSPAHDQMWHFSKKGVHGKVNDEEHYGASLVAGRFDGDGYPDLAVGVPEAWSDGIVRGQVNVLFGSADGITTRDQLWDQDSQDVSGDAEAGDSFGAALAAGNFNGDAFADLAIGTPHKRLDGVQAGAVTVLYGGPDGLATGGNRMFRQGNGPHFLFPGTASPGDEFGFAVAAR